MLVLWESLYERLSTLRLVIAPLLLIFLTSFRTVLLIIESSIWDVRVIWADAILEVEANDITMNVMIINLFFFIMISIAIIVKQTIPKNNIQIYLSFGIKQGKALSIDNSLSAVCAKHRLKKTIHRTQVSHAGIGMVQE
jgi:hypothetical protein